MQKKLKILHLEDSHSDAELIKRILKKAKLDFERLVVDTKDEFIKALKVFIPDIILCDHSLPSFNSHEALAILRKSGMKIPFILITANISEKFAEDVIKRGADDYILKDRMMRLPSAIQNSLEKFRLEAVVGGDMLQHQAFNSAAQANIIFAAAGGEIIMTNSAACKLLGYSNKELLAITRPAIFDINESGFKKMLKQRSKEKFKALMSVRKKNGKVIPCEITSAIFTGEDGIKKEIITITDMSQSILKQKNIETRKNKIVADSIAEVEGRYKMAFRSSSDVLYDIDLSTNTIMVSDGFKNEFGYALANNVTSPAEWVSHIHPDDKESVVENFRAMLVSKETEWKYNYRFLRIDNSIANVVSSGIILRDVHGSPYRMIGSVQDLSNQKALEERLEHEIKLKEKQITEAMEEAKDTQRSHIGKELHDNINQLLGASRLYIDMARRGGENSETYLNRSSEYTMTAIEEIRKLTKGLTTDLINDLGLCHSIENLVRDTMQVNAVKISADLGPFEIIESNVSNKFKLNIYRIVQEQLNNILKHAKATNVVIRLSQNKKSITLTVADNGVGFDAAKKRKGIGVDNIKSRAAAYNGKADFISQPGQGCVLTIPFPVTDTLLNTVD